MCPYINPVRIALDVKIAHLAALGYRWRTHRHTNRTHCHTTPKFVELTSYDEAANFTKFHGAYLVSEAEYARTPPHPDFYQWG